MNRLKKCLIFMLLLIIVIIGACCIANAIDNADGISVSLDEQRITVNNAPDNASVIAALYDNNILQRIKLYHTDDEMNYNADFGDKLTDTSIMKVFVWEINSIRPLYGATTRYADGRVETAPFETTPPTPSPSSIPMETPSSEPVVYMTSEISSDALMKIYEQLNFTPTGNVAVKLSTGEAGNTHYLDPNLIKGLVQSVDGTIVECNTAYGGRRASTAAHKQVAADHGYTAIADVDIMDEDDSLSIPVTGGSVLKENFVGSHLANYDSLITLSHFKGHAMGGFGGAIKNMSIGIGSSKGKAWIHSGGTSTTNPWGGEQDRFLEAMAEATSAVVDYMDGKVVYINVMNNLSVDCDCDGSPAKPEMHDVGILASYDPVALDKACVDIVYNTPYEESGALQRRIERQNGTHTLDHAEKIGLGSQSYKLVDID